MTNTWNASKTWIPKDEVLETFLNEQVYENTIWMYDRQILFVPTSGTAADDTDTTDYSTAGLVYKTLLTFPSFTITETTVLSLSYNGVFSHTAARNAQIEPVLTLNGGSEYYYSTGTTTKPTAFSQGLCTVRIPLGSLTQSNCRGNMTLAAGTYTMKLGLFLNAAGGTLTRKLNNYLENAILRVLY